VASTSGGRPTKDPGVSVKGGREAVAAARRRRLRLGACGHLSPRAPPRWGFRGCLGRGCRVNGGVVWVRRPPPVVYICWSVSEPPLQLVPLSVQKGGARCGVGKAATGLIFTAASHRQRPRLAVRPREAPRASAVEL
jgi:hypothetical protein